MFAWDDVAVFLALYRERTTVRAAATLGVSQPTVVRRIAALEQAIGLNLFDRGPGGLQPTPAADSLFESAQKIELSVCEFASEIDALSGAELNIIRITFLDHFEQLVVPILRDFASRWPGVQTQLLASDRMYDVARGEVDIAVRGRQRPSGDEVVVRELPPSGWTIYASADLPEDRRPNIPGDVAGHPIALVDGVPGTLPVYLWLQEQCDPSAPPPMRNSNYRAIKSMIAAGTALSALPCTIGDSDPEVVRCFPPLPEWDVSIYLVGRRAALRRPPARDLFDSIARHFDKNPHLLMGER